jgi:hypothetical protein
VGPHQPSSSSLFLAFQQTPSMHGREAGELHHCTRRGGRGTIRRPMPPARCGCCPRRSPSTAMMHQQQQAIRSTVIRHGSNTERKRRIGKRSGQREWSGLTDYGLGFIGGDIYGVGVGRADVVDASEHVPVASYPPYIWAGYEGRRTAQVFNAGLWCPGGSTFLTDQ